jgi:hypothetical protein
MFTLDSKYPFRVSRVNRDCVKCETVLLSP